MPNMIEFLRDMEEEHNRLFALVAGFRLGFHQPQQQLTGWMWFSKTEIFGDQHVQFFKMISYTTLYEKFEDSRHGGGKTNVQEFVCSRSIFTLFWYQDHGGLLPLQKEISRCQAIWTDQPVTGFPVPEEVRRLCRHIFYARHLSEIWFN